MLLDGTALVPEEDYTVNDSGVYTISQAALSGLSVGTHSLTFDMDSGADPVLTLFVTNSAPADDKMIEYDAKPPGMRRL